jgi:spermidine synthase
MSYLADTATPAAVARPSTLAVPVFVGTIFFSAFLLFGIQPMFTKMVLPRLGGSPGVWSVAMVFFQAMLLAGYGYAHLLVSRLGVRQAALVHLTLMAIVIAVALPIGIAGGYERPPQTGESIWLVSLFVASVGLPFFAVSANGPLLQAWFAQSGHRQAHDPYFLYAASNIGSFLALIAYPFAIEPFLPLSLQSKAWTWGFALLLAGIAVCAGLVVGRARSGSIVAAPAPVATPITRQMRAWWVGLAFVPSALLVAVTAHISTDVAAAPLLWVIPLALFLITFTIVFQRRPILPHALMLRVHFVIFLPSLILAASGAHMMWGAALATHLGVFFITAMVAHGELVKRRPEAARLTEFYFWMSFGGVLGGLFSGLIAPMIFSGVAEYPLLLIAGFLCRPDVLRDGQGMLHRRILPSACILAAMLILIADFRNDRSFRSFFGINRIIYTSDKSFRLLAHGTTVHGAQRVRNADGTPATGKPEPLAYYFRGGAISRVIDAARANGNGIVGKVAAIGLGTGSLACHAHAGEDWSFYEIDARVVQIARDPRLFSYLRECSPNAPIVVGDARLTIADARDATFDLILIDAFSSDAIPSHLMTVEAMAIYLSKLRPGGLIMFHISNRNLQLAPVVTAVAAAHGLSVVTRLDPSSFTNEERYESRSHVAVVARDAAPLANLAALPDWTTARPDPAVRAWTDDYADIVGALLRKLRE